MNERSDIRSNLACGAVVATAGAAVSVYTVTHYRLGTVSEMGSGMVPLALGIALVALGCLTGLVALLRAVPAAPAEDRVPLRQIGRPVLFIVLSILLFALLVEWIGVVPSVMIMTVVGRLAGGGSSVVASILLGGVLAVLAALIFVYGLATPLSLFWW